MSSTGATGVAPAHASTTRLTGPRRDIADMVRLVRYVKVRRASLAAEGRPTVDADELLRTLEHGLRSILPLRRPA